MTTLSFGASPNLFDLPPELFSHILSFAGAHDPELVGRVAQISRACFCAARWTWADDAERELRHPALAIWVEHSDRLFPNEGPSKRKWRIACDLSRECAALKERRSEPPSPLSERAQWILDLTSSSP